MKILIQTNYFSEKRYSRVSLNIIGLNNNKAIKLGIAISALSVSATSQIKPNSPIAPMGITSTHNNRKILIDLYPKRNCTHFSP